MLIRQWTVRRELCCELRLSVAGRLSPVTSVTPGSLTPSTLACFTVAFIVLLASTRVFTPSFFPCILLIDVMKSFFIDHETNQAMSRNLKNIFIDHLSKTHNFDSHVGAVFRVCNYHYHTRAMKAVCLNTMRHEVWWLWDKLRQSIEIRDDRLYTNMLI